MRNSPLISVIVACSNHGHFLAEAVRSVVSSSLAVEIVVIDDGSTDSTPDVAATLETSGDLRFIRQQTAGLAAARDRGLRESRGGYVVFLDADDRLAPGALDIGAAHLDEHPECAFVFGRCVMMDDRGALLPTLTRQRILHDQYRELLRRNYIWTPAVVMFRREAVERAGGFRPGVDAAADYDLYLQVARHHPICDHGQMVAHCRQHDPAASGIAGRMLRETLAVLHRQRRFLEGDEASLVAYREGVRLRQEFYGTSLANEIRTDARSRRWLSAANKSMVFARYHPRGLWRSAAHHTARVLQGIGRAARPYAGRVMPAAEISGADRVRPR